MRATFCGHGDIVYNNHLQNRLYKTILDAINTGVNEFYLGGYGNFDILAAKTVKSLQKEYPGIQSVLITPYLNHEYDKSLYDFSLYPPLEKVPKRLAIIRRNEWSVDNADIVIAYVECSWGGAARTLDYAKRKNKNIINLYE